MLQFLVKRLISSLVVLFCIMSISFFLMRFAPGGPFDQDRRLPKEVEAKLRERYGFDKPLYQQYVSEMKKYLVGDFGFSYDRPNQTVRELILETFPNSVELGFYSMLLAILLGVPAGLIAGMKQNSAVDHGVMSISMLGVSIPAIALAPLLIYIVVFQWGWLDDYIGWEGVFRVLSEKSQKPMPSGSIVLSLVGDYRFEWIYANLKWAALQKKVLPAFTLGVYYAAYFARLSRGGMLEIVRQDYIRTARAKGLSQWTIVWRHALKGALIPATTFLGPATAAILTGSIVVETIFKIPGVSKYFVTSAFNRDYPMVMGVIVLYSCLLVVMNLVVDVLYTLLDPRVSYDKT
ncbi:MAG: ABC transporter permease [Myxococcales bacterium]|nr:ABC transporter permease [Myxococcales bacterium]